MDVVAYAASFLLGGVSALLVMCFLLFFMEHPVKKHKDSKLLKQIADALEDFAEFKEPREISQSVDAEKSDALKILPENSPFKDHGLAARRLDMGYNPVPGLL
jgi:hypothetical protein